MFYPVDSLKRGGRFYLCWVADSWPLRFATITHRQLWSQDIRRISEDLLEVMTNESGRPTQRFSLRLSSQLMRGLVRLYQRKVNVFLSDMCMINANVIKSSNKKWNVHEPEVVEQVRHPLQPLQQLNIQEVVQEPPEENEQRIAEMIQASGNAVANIQDITLREPTEAAPDLLLRPNDGFGEENPDQALQQLQDRTLELMLATSMAPDVSAISATAAIADVTHTSHERSRPLLPEHQMERISEHDITMFRKSTAEELVPEFEKEIPEIPEIPPPAPEIPVPLPEKTIEEPRPEEPRFIVVEPPNEPEPVEIELEELEAQPQGRRRRLRNRLIIDKKIKINTQVFRSRIENPMVELRCEDSSYDIISIRVSPQQYFNRPSHGGASVHTNVGFVISRMFARNLGVVGATPRAEREPEDVLQRANRTITRSILERIEEEQEAPPVPLLAPPLLASAEAPGDVTAEALDASGAPRASAGVPMDLDMADVLTQKVETLSQQRKRLAEQEVTCSPKRQRSVGYVSFRESQTRKLDQVPDLEADKENRPDNLPPLVPQITVLMHDQDEENIPAPNTELLQSQNAEKIVSSMLQDAGLADIQMAVLSESNDVTQRGTSRRVALGNHSDSSETPQGSLDRTRVSLGDSERTTDSKRFIRDHWGTEGTMLKILKLVNAACGPVTVCNLIAKGPVIAGHRRIIAARCFTSILKLKQHGFINVSKHLDSLEISDITLGYKLTSSQEQC